MCPGKRTAEKKCQKIPIPQVQFFLKKLLTFPGNYAIIQSQVEGNRTRAEEGKVALQLKASNQKLQKKVIDKSSRMWYGIINPREKRKKKMTIAWIIFVGIAAIAFTIGYIGSFFEI